MHSYTHLSIYVYERERVDPTINGLNVKYRAGPTREVRLGGNHYYSLRDSR